MTETEFIKTSLPTDLFIIRDVKGDNSCFYRSIANYVYFAQPFKAGENKTYSTFQNWGDKIISPEKFKISKIIQDKLAKYIQYLIYNFVKKNPNKKLDFMGNITIKEAVPFIHEISYSEYLNYYKHFASDDIDLGYDFTIDRWGSSLELYVISEIIKCPIIVFNTQTWSRRYKKIINGKIIRNKPEKNVRLKPSIIVGEKYIGKKLPIYLIWREYYGEGHYMTLFPKSRSEIMKYII